MAKVGRLADAKAEAERVVALDPMFTMQRWSVTVGQVRSAYLLCPFPLPFIIFFHHIVDGGPGR